MNSFVLALRAIGTQFALRLYLPAALFSGIIAALLILGTLWLTTLSEWWWLLFIPLVVIISVAAAIMIIVLLLIRYVRPSQTKTQEQAVRQFVDKIQGIADVIGTPKILILFRVVRSISAPSKDHYLSDLVANRELGRDFRELQRLFDVKS